MIKPVLLLFCNMAGNKCWRRKRRWLITKAIIKKLLIYVNRCLRNILGISWPNIISNDNLWQKTNQENVHMEIKRSKYRWLIHILRKPLNAPSIFVLLLNLQRNRLRGKLRTTWRRNVFDETTPVTSNGLVHPIL